MASSLLPRSMTMSGISKLKCVQILQIASQTNQIYAYDNCFKFEHIKYHFIFEIIILTAEKFFDIIKGMIFFLKNKTLI